ncbi:hypothetical protein BO78DRAFT_267368, partial [Aspergillus sclerotiicarbonarius CBS 121057]
ALLMETSFRLDPTGEEARDILATTQHIDREIQEARRLCNIKDTLLEPDERTWVDYTVADVEDALKSVVRLLEPCRVGLETGAGKSTLSVGKRLLWALKDAERVRAHHSRLIVCHQSLTTVITFLHSR